MEINKILPHLDDFNIVIPEVNFFKIERDEFLAYKPLHERLSSAYIDFNSIPAVSKITYEEKEIFDEDEFLSQAVKFLTRTAYGLFSFITNEKLPNINLNLKSGNSYCGLTTNIIQVGLNILFKQNISRQDRVDIVVALIYHEFYHKKFTIHDLKQTLNIPDWQYIYDLKEKIEAHIDLFLPTDLHRTIHNILEDRRIERKGCYDLPGYSFTLEVKRKYGLFLHSKKLIKPDLVQGLIIDYLLCKILLPEGEDNLFIQIKSFELNGLPKLRADKKLEKTKVALFEKDFKEVMETITILKRHIEANPKTVFSDNAIDIFN